MFGDIKKKMISKIAKAQMNKQGVPLEDQEKLIALMTKNPELFRNLGLEIQAKMKEGKDQMTAAMEVMQAHKEEIQKLNQD